MKYLLIVVGLLLCTSAAASDTNWSYGVGADVDVLRVGDVTLSAEGRYIPESHDATIFGVVKLDLTHIWGAPAQA